MIGDLDELEEIKLGTDAKGSFRKWRAGHNRAMNAAKAAHKKPLWKRQLKQIKGWQKRKEKHERSR